MYIIQSQNNATIWARAIASRSSLTTINSSPVSSAFFSPRGLLHFDMHISPLFQGSIISYPSSSSSPTPSQLPIIFSSPKSVVARDQLSGLTIPAHTSTQTKWTYIVFKSVMSCSAGQYSLLSDKRASLCESSCRQSMRYKKS